MGDLRDEMTFDCGYAAGMMVAENIVRADGELSEGAVQQGLHEWYPDFPSDWKLVAETVVDHTLNRSGWYRRLMAERARETA